MSAYRFRRTERFRAAVVVGLLSILASCRGIEGGDAAQAAPTLAQETIARRILAEGWGTWGTVAPDGRTLALGDLTDMGGFWLYDIESEERLFVEVADDLETPDLVWEMRFSTDGRRIAFVSIDNAGTPDERSRLQVVRRDGTDRRTLAWDQVDPIAWLSDDSGLVARGRDGFTLLSLDGAEPRVLLRRDLETEPAWSEGGAALSPDDDLAVLVSDEPGKTTGIAVLDVATGSRKLLIEPEEVGAIFGWHPETRHLLFGGEIDGTTGLWALPTKDGRASGAPVLVRADVGDATPSGIDRSGALYYSLPVGSDWEVFATGFDPETFRTVGSEVNVAAGRRWATTGDFSPDGTALSYLAFDHGEEWDIVVRSLQTGEERRVGLRPPASFFENSWPFDQRWTSEGRIVLVALDAASGGWGVFEVNLTSGSSKMLVGPPEEVMSYNGNFDTAPHDGFLVYLPYLPDHEGVLRRRDADGSLRDLFPYDGSRTALRTPRISPDGAIVAFVLKPVDGGTDELTLVDSESGSVISRRDLPDLVRLGPWLPDGHHVFMASSEDGSWPPARWEVIDVETGRRTVVAGLPTGAVRIKLSDDGRRLAYQERRGEELRSELWVMEDYLPAGG